MSLEASTGASLPPRQTPAPAAPAAADIRQISHPPPSSTFRRSLGLPTTIRFHDIFGFEPDLLAMVPQPVHAILLLFPITEASEKARRNKPNIRKQQLPPEAVFPAV